MRETREELERTPARDSRDGNSEKNQRGHLKDMREMEIEPCRVQRRDPTTVCERGTP